jgi:hypothetical protein
MFERVDRGWLELAYWCLSKDHNRLMSAPERVGRGQWPRPRTKVVEISF